ncbi:transcriptional regulator, LacI family [Sanguibacter gelidistatuariae]|uniref:Transcriptional regulator, LacI family n=1 Tax=Sanguibacter gelidistatuariae TaxID=1814289 RepID=A0A1G6Q5D0_9MICO|nr:LacI family DNA-binding transcriptional regulator [Sanguibacter gelidistatuariae]SDC87563.1 transcriptional regulator, LacI family [Sanguibacter gelidistatuariae]
MLHTQGARPTLASVAAIAGVSRQTVSNVLNEPSRVQAETLAKVRAVLDEVNYRPHLAARQLRTKRSRVIGLRLEQVTDGINGAVLDRFLHAFTEGAQRHGYRISLFTADDDAGEIARYGELLDTTDIDAFVLTSTHHGDVRTEWLSARDIPFVTFGRPWALPHAAVSGTAPHAWVDVDGSFGTRSATEHLLSSGHRRIAFIGWPAGSGTGDERRLGWQQAMRTSGLGDDELDLLDLQTADGVNEGAAAIRSLTGHPAAPTAVVCASDSLALGALEASRSLGETFAVVGFDDTPVAAAIGLTSVAQPLIAVAEAALDLLIAQLEDRPDSTGHRLLPPRLVPRRSTATPPTTT